MGEGDSFLDYTPSALVFVLGITEMELAFIGGKKCRNWTFFGGNNVILFNISFFNQYSYFVKIDCKSENS